MIPDSAWCERRAMFAQLVEGVPIRKTFNAALAIAHVALERFRQPALSQEYVEDLAELRRLHVAAAVNPYLGRSRANAIASRIWARRFPAWPMESVIPHELANVLRCACMCATERADEEDDDEEATPPRPSLAREWLSATAHCAYDLLDYARAEPALVLKALERWRPPCP